MRRVAIANPMATAVGMVMRRTTIPCHDTLAAPSLTAAAAEGRPIKSWQSSNGARFLSSPPAAATTTVGRGRARALVVKCSGGDGGSTSMAATAAAQTETGKEGMSWAPVVPLSALPKGERRLVRQDNQDVLLLWYKGDVIAIENTSPAEGAYSEGFLNAKLTQDGYIICPSTDSTFELKTGEIKEWFPKNPVLRFLTPPLRKLTTYPVKIDSDYIYISTQSLSLSESAEVVFGGPVQAGKSASNIEVEEVKMVVDEGEAGFGFTLENELINGRSAMVGFTVLLVFELITGKGFLKGIGFLDFLYRYLQNFPILKY